SVTSNMRTMSIDLPDQKDLMKRVPKPLMEKRRRDRINHSLETLRLLLVENTCNEKLKNPKVEKAEILESAVNFLKAEQRTKSFSHTTKRGKKQKCVEEDTLESPCKRHLSYEDGMRTCLLRVSNFIASKSQELEGNMQGTMQQFQDHSIQDHLASALHFRNDGASVPGQQALTYVESTSSCMALDQSLISQRTGIYETTRTASICKQPLVLNTVWRPW
ncbi:hairy-related 5, partial [Silurus asotus]